MTITNDLWLRSQLAQDNFLHLARYNAAVCSTAAVQSWRLAVTAPVTFWSALARVSDAATEVGTDTVETAAGNVVELADMSGQAGLPEAPAPAVAAAPVAVQAEAAEGVAVETAPVETPEAAPNPVLLDAPRGGKADDLTVLAGIGPKLAGALNEFGIYHFDQLADLNADGIAWLNANQKGFAMTAERYDIVGQAKAKLNG